MPQSKSMTSSMGIRYCIGAAVAAALFLSAGAPAFAHAQLRSATPASGGTVTTAPAEVVVNFSETLEPAFSSLVVNDANGKRIDKADSRVDQSNKATMRVSLPPLGPGAYVVHWRAVTADTHRVDGTFTFRVGQ